VLAVAIAATAVLWRAAGPLDTNDAWFHLAVGQVYAREGPWPAGGDPLLHTAHADAPVQHEWLFGAGLYTLHRATGFAGLRVFHAAAVVAILALVCTLFRRAAGSGWAVGAAATVWLVLAWWRLIQLRPDLFSIAATLLLARLLLDPDRLPSWRAVAAWLALVWLWCNVHSLFGVGMALLIAAAAGHALRIPLARRAGDPALARQSASALWRLTLAIFGAGLVTLANPRGFAQHMTFLTSSRDHAIWAISDEWRPFDPFAWPDAGPSLTPLSWATADALGLALVASAVIAAIVFLRRPSSAALRRCDPVRLALAAAACVAIVVSIRFLWLGCFALLFVLAATRSGASARQGGREGWLAPATGLAALALALALPSSAAFQRSSSVTPRGLGAWLTTPYVTASYHEHGVDFLAESGVAGRLFNRYTQGGFLGYRLAPRLRTFVDGRTEHYATGVLDEYFRINRAGEVSPGESALEALDRRGVDFFFGVGLPLAGTRVYTTALLAEQPGWVMVERGLAHAIYLRDLPRNAENLERIGGWYAERGVSFDPSRGLEPLAAARANPEWAIRTGRLPEDWQRSQRALASDDAEIRYAALERLALTALLLGDHEEQLRLDRDALALRRYAKSPKRRIVHGLLRTGEDELAIQAARELVALDPSDPRSRVFERIARDVAERRATASNASFAERVARYRAARRRDPVAEPEVGWLVPPDVALNRLPLLTLEEARACCGRFE